MPFLGGAEEGLGIFLPANQDRLLVVRRETGDAEHVLRRAEDRGGIELGFVEVDGCNGRRHVSLVSISSELCNALPAKRVPWKAEKHAPLLAENPYDTVQVWRFKRSL
jgi:hypothetical protein